MRTGRRRRPQAAVRGPDKIYTARLDGLDKLALEAPSGKPVKALPSPESSDAARAEEMKASKALLSTARKELQQVAKLQRSRLYEAMCAGRRWDLAEWQTHILRHPIVAASHKG